MVVIVFAAGVVLALLAGRHHRIAQQRRQSYAGAKARLPAMRRAASEAATRAFGWIAGLAALLVVAFIMLLHSHGAGTH